MRISPLDGYDASNIRLRVSAAEPVAETMGERIRRLRIERGMQQNIVAERLGVSPSAVRFWEDDTCDPTIPHLRSLSRTLARSIDYIVNGRESAR